MCAQLGSGLNSNYPSAIDTRQVYRNSSPRAPDSDTILDAELANDILDALIQIETTLGAQPNGVFASLAARLASFLPGGSSIATLVTFTNSTTVGIPGAIHGFGTYALIEQVYDNQTPRQALEADSTTIDLASYDLTLSFISPQTGLVALGSPTPQYRTTFVTATTVTILGAVHGLATASILWRCTDNLSPSHRLQPNAFTVHPSTFDVTFTFLDAESGAITLFAASPGYLATLTNTPTVIGANTYYQTVILGTTHQLATQALLYQAYTSATPRVAFQEGFLSVHPTTFDVTVNLLSSQAGFLVLCAAPSLSTQDFSISDGGILDTSAVRVSSGAGDLRLQAGSGNHVLFLASNGTTKATLDTSTGHLGLGVGPTPSYQLQLSTDSAAKPGTSTWTVASDSRLKDVTKPFTAGLEPLLQMEPVYYRYNGRGGIPGGKRSRELIGVVADTLTTIAPYLVGSTRGKLDPGDDHETTLLTYEGHALQFMLVNAVKELAGQLSAVQAECQRLREQVAGLVQQATQEAQSMPPEVEPLA